jgi:hypothetical protein
MTTMTKEEIYNSSVGEISRWFEEDSGILEGLDEKDAAMIDIYGDNSVCPYFIALTQMYAECVQRGWSPDQIFDALKQMTEVVEHIPGEDEIQEDEFELAPVQGEGKIH